VLLLPLRLPQVQNLPLQLQLQVLNPLPLLLLLPKTTAVRFERCSSEGSSRENPADRHASAKASSAIAIIGSATTPCSPARCRLPARPDPRSRAATRSWSTTQPDRCNPAT